MASLSASLCRILSGTYTLHSLASMGAFKLLLS